LPDFGNLKVSKSATADFDARVSKDGRLRGRRLLPSFETAARSARPPQDEVDVCVCHCNMTAGTSPAATF
jgi:hypothetical protein